VRRVVEGPTKEVAIRPTPDALREQAFAVLGPELPGACFLDFFAGTGVVALEALSRGVASAYLCEQAVGAIRLIERNLRALGVDRRRWELVVGPAQKTVQDLASRGVRAAFGWCDPPFASWQLGPEVLGVARACGALGAGARVVLETPPKAHVEIAGFEVIRQLRGAVLLRCEIG
jgi:16S rRNA (guanine966-N2)-methyltransferase